MPIIRSNIKASRLKKSIDRLKCKNLNYELLQLKKQEQKMISFNKERSPIYDKTIPKEAIDSVFKKLESGELNKYFRDRIDILTEKENNRIQSGKKPTYKTEWEKKGRIAPSYSLHVIPLTKSTLGTIRILDANTFQDYIKGAKRAYTRINKYQNTFDNFQVQPINIIGIKKLKTGEYAILEKVHPSLSIDDLQDINFYGIKEANRTSRYTTYISNSLNKKISISGGKFFQLLYKVQHEYVEKIGIPTGIDKFEGNILVLDYNQKINKLLIGPIDFEGHNTQSLLRENYR